MSYMLICFSSGAGCGGRNYVYDFEKKLFDSHENAYAAMRDELFRYFLSFARIEDYCTDAELIDDGFGISTEDWQMVFDRTANMLVLDDDLWWRMADTWRFDIKRSEAHAYFVDNESIHWLIFDTAE